VPKQSEAVVTAVQSQFVFYSFDKAKLGLRAGAAEAQIHGIYKTGIFTGLAAVLPTGGPLRRFTRFIEKEVFF